MPTTAPDRSAEIPTAGRIPAHVAIIMDGNGRWAKRRMLPRIEGHRAGTKSVQRAIKTALTLGVRYLTLYTFSLENWDRPKSEVTELMKMLKQHLRRQKDSLIKEGVRLRAVGETRLLPPDVRDTLEELEAATAGGRRLDLVLALSYGSRQEMAGAAVAAAREAAGGRSQSPEISADLFERHLSTSGMPPVDLLIRTSGEHRLSNFLLWQARGAYLHFTRTLWPSFDKEHFHLAVGEYQQAAASRLALPGSA